MMRMNGVFFGRYEMKSMYLVFIAILIGSNFCSSVHAKILYELIDLGVIDGTQSSYANSINDLGQIVGTCYIGTIGQATFFDPSGHGNNQSLSTSKSLALSINNASKVAGQYGDSAAILDTSGNNQHIVLGTLGGSRSRAFSMNDSGQIVGWAYNAANKKRAVLFDTTGNGANLDLGTLGGPSSDARAINNNGVIVGHASSTEGTRATIFDLTGTGNNIDLGTVGGKNSYAYGLNNSGQIVGSANSAGSTDLLATLFDASGMGNNINLGSLGGGYSQAIAINDLGQIVGAAYTAEGQELATLFDITGAGNNIVLNELIVPNPNWILTSASAINNHGQIVGTMTPVSSGFQHAYLLNPVKELVGLEIVGPNEVAEDFEAQYTAIAHYDNNSTADVTDLAEWSVEPNDVAGIAAGLLTTEEIDLPTDVTITAQYSEGDVNESAEKDVSIFAICPSGSALEFDGGDDYVEVDDSADLEGMDNLTISTWIKPKETLGQGNVVIVDKDYATAYRFYLFDGDQTDSMAWLRIYVNGEVAVPTVNTEIDMSGDTWCHIVSVYSSINNEVQYYLNGVLEGTAVVTAGPIGTNGVTLKIGKSTRPKYFTGIIDDVRIYDKALSAEEIQALMHSRPDTDDPTLVGYWGFDEGEGEIAGDQSGSDNDGTIVGATWADSVPPVGICTPVDIDIKPGSCPNPLNVKSQGILPVAILGSPDLDVTEIDVASIFLGGVGPIRSNYEDVSAPVVDGNECECTTAAPDGFLDLTLKFYTQDVVSSLLFSEGELAQGQTLTLTLNGELYDGMGIRGTDCVVLVGNVSKWLAAQRWDANGDGVVNMVDLAELANYWLESSGK